MSRFFALSRTTHGVLDMAAPAFCALLWLGGFPRWQTILLSLATGFAAYTAIYALNDLMGMRNDRQKFAGSGIKPGFSVEASPQRHPLAQNVLSVRSGLLWAGSWFAAALVGSYLLNPVIDLVLLAAAALEVVYCLLLKITWLRTILGGLVKTSGPIAAVLVLDPRPSPYFLWLLFAWVFFWEIGGQNIPSDWNDTVEDGRVNAKTIPIRFGTRTAGIIIVGALALTVVASGFLPLISPARLGLLYVLASLLLGYFLLLRPSYRLYRFKDGGLARRLFDTASYYPLAQFALISMFLLADGQLVA
jgi:4-hydroxybenzoate polyprenyltransferase